MPSDREYAIKCMQRIKISDNDEATMRSLIGSMDIAILTGLTRLNRRDMYLATAIRVVDYVRKRFAAIENKSALNKEIKVLARWDFRMKERSTTITQMLTYLQTGHPGS